MRAGRLTGWAITAMAAAVLSGGATAFAQVKDTKKSGLHLPQDKRVNFTRNMTDGGGYTWDLQYGLYLNQGLNYIYGGGSMYLQIRGSTMSAPNGQGAESAAGDEIEIGPMNLGNVQCYRRCKVYKDVAFARWLDIYVNSTGQAQTVPVRIFSNTNSSIGSITTSSGENTFGEKDFAFVTDHQGQRVALLHVACAAKSKVRPTVQANVNNNQIYYNYELNVPANGTVIIAYFESQGKTAAEVKDRMKAFRASAMFKDLSPEVRKLIVNWRLDDDFGDIDLSRNGTYDTVLRKNGDAIYGTIANETFTIEAFYGTLPLPAKDVIGFVEVPGQDQQVRAVLSGGQVITGKLKDNNLVLKLPTGGDLKIGFDKITQCSYRISKEKPEEVVMKDPLIVLRTGDRLAFEMDKLSCTFQTRHGQINLSGKDLLEVKLFHEDHGVHRVTFLNESVLAGVLGPDRISLPIKYDSKIKLDIARDMILSIRYPNEAKDAGDLVSITLNNEDRLFGRLQDKAYDIVTEFGDVSIKPNNIVSLNFDRSQPSWVAMKLWNGTTLRGRLKQESLKFAIQPGPELDINVGQIASLECPDALPPDETVDQVKKLVAMLDAANFKDRQEAQEALEKMGPTIIPMLKKGLADKNPEVRQRLQAIIEKLGGTVPDGSPAPVDVEGFNAPMQQGQIMLRCCG